MSTTKKARRRPQKRAHPTDMAPGGHRELLQLLGIGGGGHAEVSAERLERLYREVAPQVGGVLSHASKVSLCERRD